MHFSATGRSAFALDSVVTSDSAAMSEATRLPSIAFSWAASPPSLRPRRGVPRIRSSVLDAERQASLVQALDHLVERLLAEVRNGQQVVRRALDQFADRVHLGALRSVARALGQVEVLDGKVQIGGAAGGRPHLAELEALGLLLQFGDQAHERAQCVAGGCERLARGE